MQLQLQHGCCWIELASQLIQQQSFAARTVVGLADVCQLAVRFCWLTFT